MPIKYFVQYLSCDRKHSVAFNFTPPQAECNSATEGTKVIKRKYRLIGELWILLKSCFIRYLNGTEYGNPALLVSHTGA